MCNSESKLPVVAELRNLMSELVNVIGRLNSIISMVEQEVVAVPLSESDEDSSLRQAEEAWRLDLGSSTLRAPNSRIVRFTLTEIRLLACLLRKAGEPVSYDELCGALTSGRSVCRAEPATRTVNGIVSRIRAKGTRAGVDLPIRTVRSFGYEFSDADR